MLFIALVSPLGVLSDAYLFSAHMVQHLLVTLIAPPLLLIGTPRWLFQPLVRSQFTLAIGRVLTNPILVLLVYNLIFIGWHARRRPLAASLDTARRIVSLLLAGAGLGILVPAAMQVLAG